jgi:hypothetical protein
MTFAPVSALESKADPLSTTLMDFSMETKPRSKIKAGSSTKIAEAKNEMKLRKTLNSKIVGFCKPKADSKRAPFSFSAEHICETSATNHLCFQSRG